MKKIVPLCLILLGSLMVLSVIKADYQPVTGDIIKVNDKTKPALYLIDAQGKRQLFSNAVTFWTWYSGDWSNLKDVNGTAVKIKNITQSEFDAIPSTKNIVARANSKLLKFDNSGNIYTVGENGAINKVAGSNDDSVAKKLYGDNYKAQIIITQSSFQSDYTEGQPLTVESIVAPLGSGTQNSTNTSGANASCLASVIGFSDVYTAGYVTVKDASGKATIINDSCPSLYTVKKWLCDGVNQSYANYDCANGCENNHCVKTFDPNVCTDSDSGQNSTVQGIVRGMGWTNQPLVMIDSCQNQTTLLEYYCGSLPNQTGSVLSTTVACPNGCQNGACINNDTSCGVSQHKENGICVNNLQSCTITNGTGQKSWNGTVWGDCTPLSCNSGYEKFINECKSLTCADSDGANYYVKGIVTVWPFTTADYCSGYDSKTLYEQWCDGNTTAQESHYCPAGCSNGACIQATNCASGQHLENDACLANTKSCNMLYGTGLQTWNGSAWGDCQATACSSNYEIKNGICVGITRACEYRAADLTVGNGLETWQGDSWSVCIPTSCIPGFELDGNTCHSAFHANCVDYDNGKDYFTKSYTMFSTGYGYDMCYSNHNNDLGEWYCQNNALELQYYTCPNGCNNGICVQ